jgi:hypothetical protein
MIKSKYDHGLSPKTPEYKRMYYLCHKYNITVPEYLNNKEKYTPAKRTYARTSHGMRRKSKEYYNMLYYTHREGVTVEEFCKNKELYTEKFKRTKNLEYEVKSFDYQKSIYLKREFGITLTQYNELLEKQNNCCAICERPSSEFKRMFAVDHDHLTKTVRGLLCVNCNLGLGKFHDNINTLNKAINYLTQD